MPAAEVQVVGLKQVRKVLKELGRNDLVKDLKAAGVRASEMIVEGSKQRATTKIERAAAQEIKIVKGEVPGVRIRNVSKGMRTVTKNGHQQQKPWFVPGIGAEFGAYRDRLRSTKHGPVRGWRQFRTWRGSRNNAGYMTWPTIREKSPEIARAYGEELQKIVGRL